MTTSPETYTGVSIETDPLVTTRKVWKRYDVCDRTIDRWVADPAMNFPKPVIINRRRYWRVSELVAWERQRVAGRVTANV
jgi:predicted DNA-binding transcriptional regulator AlpA